MQYALKGFYELYQQNQQQEWERARWSTTLLLNIHLDRKDKLKPKDVAVFPWEQKKKQPKLSKEQAKEILAKWQKEQ